MLTLLIDRVEIDRYGYVQCTYIVLCTIYDFVIFSPMKVKKCFTSLSYKQNNADRQINIFIWFSG